MTGHSWDPTLYAGSARHYATGRIAYPVELAEGFARELRLDRTQRLLDVGCGPGSLTLLLAPWFDESIGIDADPDMIVEAERLAAQADLERVTFRRLLAEDLPADLGLFDVITFAQSFHWLDRPRVAALARSMLRTGGVCAHVHATTHHQGVDDAEAVTTLPHPLPPHDEITGLVRRYLGPVRRAGSRLLPGGTLSGEAEIYRAAGFVGPQRFEVAGRDVVRSTDQIVAGVYSLSSATPHLFGSRQPAFESELRALLDTVSPQGRFSERVHPMAVELWAPAG